MNGNIALLMAAAFPIVCAPIAWAMGRKDGKRAIAAMVPTYHDADEVNRQAEETREMQAAQAAGLLDMESAAR